MICFRDMMFCNHNCLKVDCPRRWTDELQKSAEAWMKEPPVAFFTDRPPCFVGDREDEKET